MGPEQREATKGDEYLSYLLRLWQESGDEPLDANRPPVWRASLTSPMTGERLGFATLDDLITYLRSQIKTRASTDIDESNKRR